MLKRLLCAAMPLLFLAGCGSYQMVAKPSGDAGEMVIHDHGVARVISQKKVLVGISPQAAKQRADYPWDLFIVSIQNTSSEKFDFSTENIKAKFNGESAEVKRLDNLEPTSSKVLKAVGMPILMIATLGTAYPKIKENEEAAEQFLAENYVQQQTMFPGSQYQGQFAVDLPSGGKGLFEFTVSVLGEDHRFLIERR